MEAKEPEGFGKEVVFHEYIAELTKKWDAPIFWDGGPNWFARMRNAKIRHRQLTEWERKMYNANIPESSLAFVQGKGKTMPATFYLFSLVDHSCKTETGKNTMKRIEMRIVPVNKAAKEKLTSEFQPGTNTSKT
jgi:hypothetical protein